MTELTIDRRFALFDSVVAEQRWTANEWHRQEDGRHYLCLAAAYGEPGEIESVSECPAGMFPEWLYELMPALDDGVSDDDRPWLFQGFATRNRAMVKLDDAAWERIRTGFMIAGIRQGRRHGRHGSPLPKRCSN